MAISFLKALGNHEHALYLREQRSQLLSTNIAHADTPGYKAKDLDFKQALTQALQTKPPMALSASSIRHIPTQPGYLEHIKYRIPFQSSLDGNTVESHVEQAQFSENVIRYEANLRFLNGKFTSLKYAIKGGR